MTTLSLEASPHAARRADFERDQKWPDTPQNRRLLAAYETASEKSSRCAVAALKAERADWPNVPQYKAQAAHWETVAETLGAVLGKEIDAGKDEIILTDHWE
ncbi:hypothetical protein ACTHGN_006058 [Pseudomonas putida]